MSIANLEVRQAAIGAGIPHCRIAQKLEMSESEFSRMLKFELADSEKKRILKAIETIKAEKNLAQSEAS